MRKYSSLLSERRSFYSFVSISSILPARVCHAIYCLSTWCSKIEGVSLSLEKDAVSNPPVKESQTRQSLNDRERCMRLHSHPGLHDGDAVTRVLCLFFRNQRRSHAVPDLSFQSLSHASCHGKGWRMLCSPFQHLCVTLGWCTTTTIYFLFWLWSL